VTGLMTYTRCPACAGTLEIAVGDHLHPCPCTRSPLPGWAATGLTLRQQERAVRMEAVAKDLLKACEEVLPWSLNAIAAGIDGPELTKTVQATHRIPTLLRAAIARAKGESP
jgi:hypothetical protein